MAVASLGTLEKTARVKQVRVEVKQKLLSTGYTDITANQQAKARCASSDATEGHEQMKCVFVNAGCTAQNGPSTVVMQ